MNEKNRTTKYESYDSDSNLLEDSLKRIKMLELDYKALHEKRLQDVSIYNTE